MVSASNAILQDSAAQVASASAQAKANAQKEPSKAEKDGTKLSQDFDDFLKLLTTQLQNQDPLDPTDTTEFTNQLVGFSQVEQQINLNTKLDNLIGVTSSNSLQQALGYIGLQASYTGVKIYTPGDGGVSKIDYNFSQAVSSAKVRIVNDAGETVWTSPISKNAGANQIEWDGRDTTGKLVSAGSYKVLIDAENFPDVKSKIDISVSSRVTGIESKDGKTYLSMGDFSVLLSDIKSADIPKQATPPRSGV
jgi:flagellar basal-body rod modification protein FlgD